MMLTPYDMRGFTGYAFRDRYETLCSIQESSLAEEPALWLGVHDAQPMVLASRAAGVGVETPASTGWVPYPMPEHVFVNTRMHLTQRQVIALLPMLQHFAKTGELPAPSPEGGRDDG